MRLPRLGQSAPRPPPAARIAASSALIGGQHGGDYSLSFLYVTVPVLLAVVVLAAIGPENRGAELGHVTVDDVDQQLRLPIPPTASIEAGLPNRRWNEP